MSLNENPDALPERESTQLNRPGGLGLADCDVFHHALDGLDGGAPHLRSHLKIPFSLRHNVNHSDFVSVSLYQEGLLIG